MFSKSLILSCLAIFVATSSVSASVFLPYDAKGVSFSGSRITNSYQNNDFGRRELTRLRQSCSTNGAAMAIPGYGIAEQVFVGGFMNFLSIYNLVITARILLSWVPQAQSIGVLQPVFQITDPYLNLFRGIIPPVFGLDLSPLLAFFLLNALTSATAAVGAEITPELQKKLGKKYSAFGKKRNTLISYAP